MELDNLTDRIANLSPAKRALLEMKLKEKSAVAGVRRAIPRRSPLAPATLSFAQERLWFLDQLEPESRAYNQPRLIRLKGELDEVALRSALDSIIARHEVLRTTYHAGDEYPIQVVGESRGLELPTIDVSSLQGEEQETKVQKIVLEWTERRFDLSRDLMLRAALLRLGPAEHVLLLVSHHIASDGWSGGVLWRELVALYGAFSSGKPDPLPALDIQYADYAVWQRQWLQGELLEAQLSYWKHQLSNLSVLELLGDRPRPSIQSYRGAKQSRLFPRALSDQLQALSRNEGVTLFMTLLAAFQTLLHRYTGQDDVAVGSPIAGRLRPEIEGLIGFFVNTLVLRSDLSGNPTFKELLSRVRKTAFGAYEHQDVPFEKLVEVLHPERDLSRSPLVQVWFAFQNIPRQVLALPGLTVSPVEVQNETAKFDLSLYMWDEPKGLAVKLEYNTDLFETSTIDRLLGHFRTLVEGIVADPNQRLSELPLLNEAEKHQLLVDWNATHADSPKDKHIHELFEEQVERSPDAIAIIFEEQQLTYRDLNNRANQLAHYLQRLGVGPEALVGICVERSIEMVVGLLGILKAGGAYVPLDPDYPKERLAFMLADTQIVVLLTQDRLRSKLPEHGAPVLCLDSGLAEFAQQSTENPAQFVSPENLVYVIYTSGSTGRPKGAMNTHRGLCNRLHWMQQAYELSEVDRVLQKTPFSFDVSVWEFFWPLITGACLVVARPSGHQDSRYIVELIMQQQITTLHFVPSMLRIFLEEPGIQNCKSLRQVICSGEALPYDLQERFFESARAKLHNLYGPTEASIDVTYWECQRRGDCTVVPIGRPIANTQIHLLDSRLRLVPIGVVGELYIGGEGLARGYLNRADLTGEKFIPSPFSGHPGERLYKTGDLARYLPDGNIEFLGRIDHQVKIRGFRIELGEIEMVLSQHPAVGHAVVVDKEFSGDKRLIAYVVPKAADTPSGGELKEFLRVALPEYMVPSAFVSLQELPLTPNGKLDRKALPEPKDWGEGTRGADEFVSPRTAMEQCIAQVWQEVLGVDRVSAHDNFFDLGGHSLLSLKVIAKIEEKTGRRIHPRDMILQTLGQIAAACEQVASPVQAPPEKQGLRKWLNTVTQLLRK